MYCSSSLTDARVLYKNKYCDVLHVNFNIRNINRFISIHWLYDIVSLLDNSSWIDMTAVHLLVIV